MQQICEFNLWSPQLLLEVLPGVNNSIICSGCIIECVTILIWWYFSARTENKCIMTCFRYRGNDDMVPPQWGCHGYHFRAEDDPGLRRVSTRLCLLKCAEIRTSVLEQPNFVTNRLLAAFQLLRHRHWGYRCVGHPPPLPKREVWNRCCPQSENRDCM